MLATRTGFRDPQSSPDVPLFQTMLPAECEAVLSRNNVGRIAFALHDRVNIVPINYVYRDGWVFGRTSSARKLRDILRNRRIAFEVDEHSDVFEWRSVIVRGPLYLIQPDATQRPRSVYQTALSAIRQLTPAALTTADPIPYRDQLFRIKAADVSGRSSQPSGGTMSAGAKPAAILETAQPDADARLLADAKMAVTELEIADASNINLEAFDGVLVLSGTVENARDKQEIEAALLGVPAVDALVQELETEFPSRKESLPAELARAAHDQLLLAPSLASLGIKVVVENGWLRLEGAVASDAVRNDVLRRVRRLEGSRGVIDRLRIVKSRARAGDRELNTQEER